MQHSQMAKVSRLENTAKDFRDYDLVGAFQQVDFTRVLDRDLDKMWGVMNKVHDLVGQPRFVRSGTQEKLREVLSWGTRATNKVTCIVPRVARAPEEVVSRLLNWQHRVATQGGKTDPSLIDMLDDCLTRPAEF